MSHDYDVIVIGSGPGGYIAAIKAAQLGLKTACVEKYPVLGGTCLNVGCIPSKSLLQSSELYYKMSHHGKDHGIKADSLSFDFDQMMKRKEGIIKGFNQGISGLFKKNKVKEIHGTASFVNPNEIEVKSGNESIKLSAKSFILATGSKPTELPFLKLDEKVILSSTGALSLKEVPKKLVIVGAGIIGVELGSVYSRLGSEVVFLEFLDKICPTLDGAICKGLQKELETQGLKFHLGAKVTAGEIKGSKVKITASMKDGASQGFEADKLMLCIGRRPYTDGLGLEKIGVSQDERGFVKINENFQTSQSHILAIGDIVDGPMLAHKAEEEGSIAAELLAGQKASLNYLAIPSVVYTDPEVGAVGLSEERAKELNLPYKAVLFPFKANSRAKCMGEDSGFVKVIIDKNTMHLLGVHIIGPHAGELIAEASLAITHNLTAKDVAHTCHAHPTLSEAFKEACLFASFKALHI